MISASTDWWDNSELIAVAEHFGKVLITVLLTVSQGGEGGDTASGAVGGTLEGAEGGAQARTVPSPVAPGTRSMSPW